MKNINENKKRNCIIYNMEELSTLLSELFNDKVEVTMCDFEFDVNFTNYKPDVWYYEVCKKLSEYFDVEVTSIHLDQFDYPLVWIVYKEKTI